MNSFKKIMIYTLIKIAFLWNFRLGWRIDEVCSVPHSRILGDCHFAYKIRKKRDNPVINDNFQIFIFHSVNTGKITQTRKHIQTNETPLKKNGNNVSKSYPWNSFPSNLFIPHNEYKINKQKVCIAPDHPNLAIQFRFLW